MAVASIAGGLISLVQGGATQSSLSAAQTAQTVVSETSTTSLNGQVTTITTYADGSSRTTVSDGDVVVIRSALKSA